MLLLASTAHLGYECMDGWMDTLNNTKHKARLNSDDKMFLTPRFTAFRFSRKSTAALQEIRLKTWQVSNWRGIYITPWWEKDTDYISYVNCSEHWAHQWKLLTLYKWWTMNACSATDRTYIARGAARSWPLDLWPWWRSAGHRTHTTVSSLIHNDVSMQSHTRCNQETSNSNSNRWETMY